MLLSSFSPNFFNGLLPPDLVQYLLQWLQVQSRIVKLIEGMPSDDQKNAVTATALSAYHLIVDDPDESGNIVYSIGFCKRNGLDHSLIYEIQVLNEKSPLLRYMREDRQHPEYSKLFPYDPATNRYQQNSQDRLLLKYLELEIKAAGGLTQHPLRDLNRLKAVCKANRDHPVLKCRIRQTMMEELSHHIVYGEEKEAMAIVESDLSLVLSYRAAYGTTELSDLPPAKPVVSCSPEIEYLPLEVPVEKGSRRLPIPAFMLAALAGDWFILKGIVHAVESSTTLSDEEKLDYKSDLLMQLAWAETGKANICFNNLLNKGVQILDGNILENNEAEQKRYQNDVVNRNSYHLIITTENKDGELMVVSCVLAYRDPATRAYRQYGIPNDYELFTIAPELYKSLQNANDGYGLGVQYEHFFTRSNRDLALVHSILKNDLGIETQWIESTSGPKFDNLLGYFDCRIKNWDGLSPSRKYEQWHGEISAEFRLFPAVLWQFWMSDKNPWIPDEKKVKAFLNCPNRLRQDKNYFKESLMPVSLFLGNKFSPSNPWAHRKDVYGCPLAHTFLKIYHDSRDARIEEVKRILAGQSELEPGHDNQLSYRVM